METESPQASLPTQSHDREDRSALAVEIDELGISA
jgi:hypothetical protein